MLLQRARVSVRECFCWKLKSNATFVTIGFALQGNYRCSLEALVFGSEVRTRMRRLKWWMWKVRSVSRGKSRSGVARQSSCLWPCGSYHLHSRHGPSNQACPSTWVHAANHDIKSRVRATTRAECWTLGGADLFAWHLSHSH